jgi:predicted nucleic acid-binding protein
VYTLDASVFVNATEPHEVDHAASRQFLVLLHAHRLPVIVPTLVVVEVAGTVSRLRDAGRAARVVSLLLRLPNLKFVSLDE